LRDGRTFPSLNTFFSLTETMKRRKLSIALGYMAILIYKLYISVVLGSNNTLFEEIHFSLDSILLSLLSPMS
jgi:hypothetical protein